MLVVDKDGITQQALLPMKSTQFKKSKQWNSAMRAIKMKDRNGNLFTPPRFSHLWKLVTVSEENKNGSWHGWQISKDDAVADVGIYQEAKLFAESISKGLVKVRHTRDDPQADSREDDVPF